MGYGDLFNTYHKFSYNCGPQVTFRLNGSYGKSNHSSRWGKMIHILSWIESRMKPQRRIKNVHGWRGQEEYSLFCSTGVSGGDSVLIKVLLSSAIREPEYTARSSQMDRILPTDFITLRSPSKLEKKNDIIFWVIYSWRWKQSQISNLILTWPACRHQAEPRRRLCGKRWRFSSYSSGWHHWPRKKGWAGGPNWLQKKRDGVSLASQCSTNVRRFGFHHL